MGKTMGVFCIVLGAACLAAALGFAVYNSQEEKNGAQASQSLLQDLQLQMQEKDSVSAPVAQPQSQPEGEILPDRLPEPTVPQMQTVSVNGYQSIGILSIPVLEIELPVLTDWSYEKLQKAPCHYFGSCYEPNFVIAAHNFRSHFGRLTELLPGDLVLFTDVTGQRHIYEVVLLETLPATATEEMITSGFDLSLYTCTPGGSNRVTVRCKSINP